MTKTVLSAVLGLVVAYAAFQVLVSPLFATKRYGSSLFVGSRFSLRFLLSFVRWLGGVAIDVYSNRRITSLAVPAQIPYILLNNIWTPEEMSQLMALAKNIGTYQTAAKDQTSSVEHIGMLSMRVMCLFFLLLILSWAFNSDLSRVFVGIIA
jgi:hypothetical protein